MKKIIPLACLVLLQMVKATGANAPDFKRHSLELSVAAGLDHQFVVRKYKDPVMGQIWKASERPFAGFCFGAQYIYRPIGIFGISTGLEYMMYGNRMGKTEEYYGNGPYVTTSVYTGYGFEGYMGVPVYVHIYQQIDRIGVEFTTGPEFFFDVYSMENYQISYPPPYYAPWEPTSIHDTRFANNSQIAQSASLAWSVQLMANIPVKKVLMVSIGPEWKFLDLKQLAPGNNVDHSVPREVPFFLGVKAGFRFGSNFWKKAG